MSDDHPDSIVPSNDVMLNTDDGPVAGVITTGVDDTLDLLAIFGNEDDVEKQHDDAQHCNLLLSVEENKALVIETRMTKERRSRRLGVLLVAAMIVAGVDVIVVRNWNLIFN
mmetsp:Transcript_34430/g.35023  ORF Transcript_34430/g.35023 Transcript_34430/m.35023 type:complete len:112 (+) Transcript_34430:131-466(+)